MLHNKRGVFFIVVFTLLFLFSYSVILYSQQQKKIDEISNQFYTKNHAKFLDSEPEKWINLSKEGESYRIFIELNDTFRFFYQNNDTWSPPIEKGRSFLPGETENKALVGREMQDHIFKKNDLDYIDFEGKLYEVVGIIGNSYQSPADYLILISSKEIPKTSNTKVILDSSKSQNVKKITSYMMKEYESLIELEQNNRGLIRSTSSNLFSKIFVTNSILLVIFCVTFYLRYWFEQKLGRMQLLFLLGAPISKIFKDGIKDLLINIFFAIMISNIIVGISLSVLDIDLLFVQVIVLIYSLILFITFFFLDYHKKRNGVLFHGF